MNLKDIQDNRLKVEKVSSTKDRRCALDCVLKGALIVSTICHRTAIDT